MKRKKRGCLNKLVSTVLLICILFLGVRTLVHRLFPIPYREAVDAAAEQFSVSPALLYAVMKAESNFDAQAVSARGAKGLMQLMENTASWCAKEGKLSFTNIFDATENITIGAYYIDYLLDMYGGSTKSAMAAYNAGHGRVDGWLLQEKYSHDGQELDLIPFAETERYVKKIVVYQKIYELRIAGKI